MTPEAFLETVVDSTVWSKATMDRLRKLKSSTTTTSTVLDADPEISGITVYPGDLHVKDDFSFNSHVLVLGNLTVDGIINGDPEHAILMVAGNVRCTTLAMVRVYLLVTGDVDATNCVYATAYGKAMVAGRINTRLYAHSNFANLDLERQPTVENIGALGRLDLDEQDARAKLRGVFNPARLPAKKSISVWDLMEEIVIHEDAFVPGLAKN